MSAIRRGRWVNGIWEEIPEPQGRALIFPRTPDMDDYVRRLEEKRIREEPKRGAAGDEFAVKFFGYLIAGLILLPLLVIVGGLGLGLLAAGFAAIGPTGVIILLLWGIYKKMDKPSSR